MTEELRMVVTDNRHFIAPLHTQRGEAAGQHTDLIDEYLAPTPFLPGTEGFFTDSNVRVSLCPFQQAFRKGVEGGVPGA